MAWIIILSEIIWTRGGVLLFLFFHLFSRGTYWVLMPQLNSCIFLSVLFICTPDSLRTSRQLGKMACYTISKWWFLICQTTTVFRTSCTEQFLNMTQPRMDSFVQIWAEGSRKPWRNPHYCYFKWLQETRAPTHVMGFPLHVPQQQDVLNMGIWLLTSTLFFFPSRGSSTLGGWVRVELRDR